MKNAQDGLTKADRAMNAHQITMQKLSGDTAIRIAQINADAAIRVASLAINLTAEMRDKLTKAEFERDAAYARGREDENKALEQTATGFGVGLTANCRDDRAYNKAVQEIAGAIRARRAPQAETEG